MTLVAALVVVPATVKEPLLVAVVSSFRLFTLNAWMSALLVRQFKLPAASYA